MLPYYRCEIIFLSIRKVLLLYIDINIYINLHLDKYSSSTLYCNNIVTNAIFSDRITGEIVVAIMYFYVTA